MQLRRIAEGIAEFIAQDEVLHEDGHVSVVVEDKGDFGYQIAEALGSLGVCVTVAVTSFSNVPNSPLAQGRLELQISCYEHPTLNRDDPSVLTAQGVMERLVDILHYRRFPFMPNQLIFKDFRREDSEEANIARGNFETNVRLKWDGRDDEGQTQKQGE
jgi:hypothetical protein